jgi:UDP-N-acetylmuramyl pentapeptide synthase
VSRVGGVTILNDTYNANPDSVLAALDTLRSIRCRGRKIVILGDMLELGEWSRRDHNRIGAAMERMGFQEVLTFGTMAKFIYERSKVGRKSHFNEKDRLLAHLIGLISPGDIVLVKGSRGMKMEDVVLFLEDQLKKRT